MCHYRIINQSGMALFLWVFVFILSGCNNKQASLDDITDDSSIVNAGFEKKISFEDVNSVWRLECWKTGISEYEWQEGKGYNQTNCIFLSSPSIQNDIALVQKIQLEGDKVYQLTAWIKTDKVTGEGGANICLFGTWLSSKPLSGTNDWQQVSVIFTTPESGEVEIACRLGFWGGTSTGKAWFDNIQISEADMFEQKSKHIRLRLKDEDASTVEPSTITNWLDNLDLVYEKYYDLIGEYPYNRNMITIFSVDTYPGGWALAGNSILWYQPYVRSTLLNIQSKGDWSFGIMHEMGHNFAPNIGIEGNSNWNWSEEMFANFRMYYAVELLNATVVLDKVYTGSELKNYYKIYAGGSYENKIRKGMVEGAHDGIMYTLIRIKDEIGWDPFKQTFRYLYKTNTNLISNWQKFNLFLNQLSEFSGTDVRQTYPEGELDIIKDALNNY